MKIKEIATQIRGVSYKPENASDNPLENYVPLLRAHNIQDDGLNFERLVYVDKSKVKPVQYVKKGDIVICASSGSLNLVGKAAQATRDYGVAFGAFCKVIRLNASVNFEYVGHFFHSDYYRDKIMSVSEGANINNIRAEHIDDIEIPLPSLPEQHKIAAVLDKVSDLISKRRKQLDKLDELVKAKFVEMFGDPETNSWGLPTKVMTEICTIIDGDRGKHYPKQDELSSMGDCLFLNAKNVTSSGFAFDTCMYITEEKDRALHKGKLKRGDVVLTTRGTLGNLAFYNDSVPFENIRINSGMVILRMNQNIISEVFFIEQFRLQLQSIKEKIASGSAQPQLPISTMNRIHILVAPMYLQEQFAAFVHQTDKVKSTVRQSLAKLELLKKSLMQEYFG